MAPEILQTLRKECNSLHEGLHHHKLLAPLSSADITMNDYKKIISAFYIAYSGSEKNLNITVPQNVPNAPVMEWLNADVKIHNIKIPDANPKVIIVDNISKLAGYLYTKQGSTLGGQVISKHLQKTLGLEPGVTNNFFSGYGDDTGPKWKEFMNFLINSEGQLNMEEAVETAKAGFNNISFSCDFLLGLGD